MSELLHLRLCLLKLLAQIVQGLLACGEFLVPVVELGGQIAHGFLRAAAGGFGFRDGLVPGEL